MVFFSRFRLLHSSRLVFFFIYCFYVVSTDIFYSFFSSFIFLSMKPAVYFLMWSLLVYLFWCYCLDRKSQDTCQLITEMINEFIKMLYEIRITTKIIVRSEQGQASDSKKIKWLFEGLVESNFEASFWLSWGGFYNMLECWSVFFLFTLFKIWKF